MESGTPRGNLQGVAFVIVVFGDVRLCLWEGIPLEGTSDEAEG